MSGLRRLEGAWVAAARREGDRLTLEVEDVRSGLMVGAGTVVFTGVSAVEVTSERPLALRGVDSMPRGRVVSCRSAPGETALEVHDFPGPGEVDERTFTIRHAGLEVEVKPSLGRSLRRAVGGYPAPRDLVR